MALIAMRAHSLLIRGQSSLYLGTLRTMMNERPHQTLKVQAASDGIESTAMLSVARPNSFRFQCRFSII